MVLFGLPCLWLLVWLARLVSKTRPQHPALVSCAAYGCLLGFFGETIWHLVAIF